MLMCFYIGYAIGHMYAHNSQHFRVPNINSELEDINIDYTPDKDKESSSGSDSDPESMSSIPNLMDADDKDDNRMYISE